VKRLWSIFRTGLIAIIPLALLIFLAATVFGVILDFLNFFDFTIFETAIFNTAVKFICLAALILLLGLLVSWKTLRNLIQFVFSKIPLVSDFVNIFFGDDYIERIKKGNFPVVKYEIFPGVKMFGCVTHQEENLALVFLPTVPCPLTGYIFEVAKDKLEPTGLKARQLFKMMVAFGLNYGQLQKAVEQERKKDDGAS